MTYLLFVSNDLYLHLRSAILMGLETIVLTTTDLDTNALCAAIAAGDYVCIRQAADRLRLGYWTVWRRLRREAVPTFRLRGRRYVAVADLQNPALRVS